MVTGPSSCASTASRYGLNQRKTQQLRKTEPATSSPLRQEDFSVLPQLEKVQAADVDVVTLNVAFGNQTGRAALAMIAAFRHWLEAQPDKYRLVFTADDIQQTYASAALGVCFDIEGMDALDGDVDHVQTFYDLGVRWMLAAYNRPNAAGGGCLADDNGLTQFGRHVVAEMNRVGMVVCASHCGYRTARDMIDASAYPVIFSHSNPRMMWPHPRKIPDDLMKACAARGGAIGVIGVIGVIGITGFGEFLGANDNSTATYISHIEYALDLVGDDHVGIATDYVFDRDELDTFIASDRATFPPHLYTRGANMIEPWRLPELAQTFAARGHSTKTLQKSSAKTGCGSPVRSGTNTR